MKKLRFNKEEISWILYDVGNSAFVLIMVTAIMPLYFKQIAAQGTDGSLSTALWGYANAGASFILAILAPILGTISDYKGMKKRFFSFFLVAGLIFTLMLLFPAPGMYLATLVFYVLARTCWSGSLVFYDSFITDVTNNERIDRVSAHGFGWGYIGSVIPFLAVLAGVLVLSPPGGVAVTQTSGKLGFIIVTIWWALFSIPMLKNVSQKNYVDKAASIALIGSSFKRIFETMKNISRHKNIVVFLLAYFFYIDGVHTIISMSIAYGEDIGLGTVSMIAAVLMIQILAFPFAILYGRSASRFSAKSLISTGIIVYIVITGVAFYMSSIHDLKVQTILFWVLAFLVASSMGGVQALSRSLFGRIIPDASSGEFFGFYNIFGKFAAILGPLLMGGISQVSGNSGFGILGILPLFIIGLFILMRVKEKPEEELIA